VANLIYQYTWICVGMHWLMSLLFLIRNSLVALLEAIFAIYMIWDRQPDKQKITQAHIPTHLADSQERSHLLCRHKMTWLGGVACYERKQWWSAAWHSLHLLLPAQPLARGVAIRAIRLKPSGAQAREKAKHNPLVQVPVEPSPSRAMATEAEPALLQSL